MPLIFVVKQPDNDKDAATLNRTISMTKKDQGKILENIPTMLFVGTEVRTCCKRNE